MEIAVLVNSEGNTSGFEKDGEIRVYTKDKCRWSMIRRMEYRLKDGEDSGSLHEKIREICNWLADCRIIVVSRIRGIHYIAFEEKQISMLEINGAPDAFLDDIGECLKHERSGQKVPMEHNAIFELRSGVYHTDLREVMNGNTSYNSRQILLPFLKNREYTSLEILCDHVPKWLEKEQLDLNLRISIEKYKTCMKVKVYPVKE
ncbi:Fe-only nitrogenase accessory AnfO family protein [Lachnospiraceae bacterium 54-53]